jgi:hypothetical protein
MHTKEIKIQDKTIKLETGKIAKQTSGSVMVTSGETMVLVTVCASKGKAEDRGFFPLSVDYREKFYAAGRGKKPLSSAFPLLAQTVTSTIVSPEVTMTDPDVCFAIFPVSNFIVLSCILISFVCILFP